MKNRTQKRVRPGQEEAVTGDVIAQFGESMLMRVDGQIVLRGGSMADRTEALEWLSLNMPEAVASLK